MQLPSPVLWVTKLILIFKKNNENNQSPNYQEKKETEQVLNDEEKPVEEEQVFCTQDVMKCPDGSYVGREPPDCKFKKCPTSKFEIKWKNM